MGSLREACPSVEFGAYFNARLPSVPSPKTHPPPAARHLSIRHSALESSETRPAAFSRRRVVDSPCMSTMPAALISMGALMYKTPRHATCCAINIIWRGSNRAGDLESCWPHCARPTVARVGWFVARSVGMIQMGSWPDSLDRERELSWSDSSSTRALQNTAPARVLSLLPGLKTSDTNTKP